MMHILDQDHDYGTYAACYWTLQPPQQFENPIALASGNGSVPATDTRREVAWHEALPGTQYYCMYIYSLAPGFGYHLTGEAVARLRINFGGHSVTGTGFMVSEDIMVTAGHCIYDWSGQHAIAASALEAYFGYNSSGWTETRYGIAAIVNEEYTTKRLQLPWDWQKDGEWKKHGHWSKDFALVRLSPRQNQTLPPLQLFESYNLGFPAASELTIVGFPTDRGNGLKMMEGNGKVVWGQDFWNLKLEHQLRTFGGASGGPILLGDRKTVVGIHVAGNDLLQDNLACPFGFLGVHIRPYSRALNNYGFVSRATEWRGGVWIHVIDIAADKEDEPYMKPTKA